MASKVAAVVLAAGLSTRMAPRNKLLVTDAAGVAMAARVVRACAASRVDEVVVVVGHQADAVMAAVGDASPEACVRFVLAERFADGLSASLRAGVAALDEAVAAALICLGDMPVVPAWVMDRLIGAWSPAAGRLIVVPTHGGRRGNPVLWDSRLFGEMMRLRGDTGARGLLVAHAGSVCEIEMASEAVLLDFDTAESLG